MVAGPAPKPLVRLSVTLDAYTNEELRAGCPCASCRDLRSVDKEVWAGGEISIRTMPLSRASAKSRTGPGWKKKPHIEPIASAVSGTPRWAASAS